LLCIAASAALAGEPDWALISTEVDDEIDGTGTFVDREVLTLFPPDFDWSYDENDVFFDPGDVLGVETGLDAFDIWTVPNPGLAYFFSSEVDFDYAGEAYEDEDLLMYDPGSGAVSEAFDVKDVMGADYGLDAASFVYDPVDDQTILAFSTEVGGTEMIEGAPTAFTDGDILVTDGTDLIGWLPIQQFFEHQVGLDALQVWFQENDVGDPELVVLFSTEVDGEVRIPDNDLLSTSAFVPFKDQDLLQFTFAFDEGPGGLANSEIAWRGIEDGFGKDVGLDALYVEMPIPEPASMLLVGLGIGVVALRRKRRS
jgi:hypothetical protein